MLRLVLIWRWILFKVTDISFLIYQLHFFTAEAKGFSLFLFHCSLEMINLDVVFIWRWISIVRLN